MTEFIQLMVLIVHMSVVVWVWSQRPVGVHRYVWAFVVFLLTAVLPLALVVVALSQRSVFSH